MKGLGHTQWYSEEPYVVPGNKVVSAVLISPAATPECLLAHFTRNSICSLGIYFSGTSILQDAGERLVL